MSQQNDIGQELFEKVLKSYQSKLKNDKTLRELQKKLEDESISYKDAHKLALKAGELLAQAYAENISEEVLPDGKMYYNIAKKIISPTAIVDYQYVSKYCEEVQQKLNEQAQIHIAPQIPEYDEQRIHELEWTTSQAEHYNDAKAELESSIINHSQSIVDRSIKKNVDLHAKAGLEPKIIRTAEAPATKYRKIRRGKKEYKYPYQVPCEWCQKLEGVWDYADAEENGVYRRHKGCQCIVEYDPADGKGKVQDAHNKTWYKQGDIEGRKEAAQQFEEAKARREKIARDNRVLRSEAINRLQNELGYSAKGADFWWRTNKKYVDQYGLDYMIDYTRNGNKSSRMMTQEDISLKVPDFENKNFDGYNEFAPSELERKVLKELQFMEKDDHVEHIAYLYSDGNYEIGTSNNSNNVKVEENMILGKTKLFHNHTSVSPLSNQDLKLLTREEIDEIGVICNNGDAYIVRIAGGIKPSEVEFESYSRDLDIEIDNDLMNQNYFYDLSLNERNYLFFKEKAYRISRHFEWIIEGGDIDE